MDMLLGRWAWGRGRGGIYIRILGWGVSRSSIFEGSALFFGLVALRRWSVVYGSWLAGNLF